jgi:murein tripeptide amidase MpaA
LTRLLGLETEGVIDDQAKRLLGLYRFYVVPCMCPDGAVRGHLRTNACGANLNREWTTKDEYEAPTLHRSPEVYWVLKKMDETGVDFFADIHGDEELPYNFLSGAEKIPKWTKRMESLHGAFCAAYTRANPDMQQSIGYPPSEDFNEVLKYMNVATNQVANRFDCFGATLEMPFKDCLSNSDPDHGWNPERSRQLGASLLAPLEYIHPYLRAEGEFWLALPEEDGYIAPTDDYQNELPGATFEFKMLKKRFYSDVHEMHKPTK